MRRDRKQQFAVAMFAAVIAGATNARAQEVTTTCAEFGALNNWQADRNAWYTSYCAMKNIDTVAHELDFPLPSWGPGAYQVWILADGSSSSTVCGQVLSTNLDGSLAQSSGAPVCTVGQTAAAQWVYLGSTTIPAPINELNTLSPQWDSANFFVAVWAQPGTSVSTVVSNAESGIFPLGNGTPNLYSVSGQFGVANAADWSFLTSAYGNVTNTDPNGQHSLYFPIPFQTDGVPQMQDNTPLDIFLQRERGDGNAIWPLAGPLLGDTHRPERRRSFLRSLRRRQWSHRRAGRDADGLLAQPRARGRRPRTGGNPALQCLVHGNRVRSERGDNPQRFEHQPDGICRWGPFGRVVNPGLNASKLTFGTTPYNLIWGNGTAPTALRMTQSGTVELDYAIPIPATWNAGTLSAHFSASVPSPASTSQPSDALAYQFLTLYEDGALAAASPYTSVGPGAYSNQTVATSTYAPSEGTAFTALWLTAQPPVGIFTTVPPVAGPQVFKVAVSTP